MTVLSNAEMDASIRALLVARGMSVEGLADFDLLCAKVPHSAPDAGWQVTNVTRGNE